MWLRKRPSSDVYLGVLSDGREREIDGASLPGEAHFSEMHVE
jgi:hypothetical protein